MDRDFKGVWIPADIWLDTRLSALDKIILAEIDSLDVRGRGCYANNEYIAEFCQCSVSKVSHSISLLTKAGYIVQEKSNGRQRVLKTRLSWGEPPEQPQQEPPKAAERKNNSQVYKDIVDYLNATAGTKYRASSKATQAHINARLKEGYTVADFKTVIDRKSTEWKGTEFEQYLCPETLFGTKFEKYLNAPAAKKKNKRGSMYSSEGASFDVSKYENSSLFND